MTRASFIFGTVMAAMVCVPATAMDTAFSYQGRLSDAGSPATGDYDFQFILFSAEIGGSQVGPILYGDDVVVSDGYFTIYLDFGAGIFDGTNLWLEVSVRTGLATGTYTPLAPRQAILPSPYSLYSSTISWDDIDGMPNDFADGVDDDTTYQPGNQLNLVSDTFNVSEGPGSGLDADTIDGQDSGAFAASTHLHSGSDITTGTVAEPRVAASITRDSEIMPIVLASDGSGSTLDADLLDGNNASAFAPSFTVGNGLDYSGNLLVVDPSEFNADPNTTQTSTSPVVTTDSWTTVYSRSITAPNAPGRVVAIASTESRCSDCPGGDSGAILFGLQTSQGAPSFYSRMYTGPDAGTIYAGTTVFQVFSVAANSTTTVYLRSRSENSGDTFYVYSPRILLFFVPD